MIRLHVTAEGQTEKNFVRVILTPHLANYGVYADARCVYTSPQHRGGLIRPYAVIKRDIENWMKEDRHPQCRFTTMFDLYAQLQHCILQNNCCLLSLCIEHNHSHLDR